MADDDLRIRLRPRGSPSQDSAERARRLRAAMTKLRRRTDQTGRKRSARAGAYGGPASLRQKSLVKVQFVPSRSPGGWRAHGRYLGREGAQRESERGQGFDVDSRRAQLGRYHGIWRKAASRLWRDGGLAFHLAANAEDQEEEAEK
jgi:hypothetical protein